MSTQSKILSIAEDLILSRGYNAFSFADISQSLGIRKASIHYYYPSKKELGEAVIDYHIEKIKKLIKEHEGNDPLSQFIIFLSIYEQRFNKNQICMIGSMSTDLNTLHKDIHLKLQELSSVIINWLTTILESGKDLGIFDYKESSRSKALMIITNILAAIQISRVTDSQNFELIKSTLIQNIIQ